MLAFAIPQVVHATETRFDELPQVKKATSQLEAGCTADGQDCSLTGCCLTEGSTCFKKNQWWSSCNATCNPYRVYKDGKWQDTPDKTWDCDVVNLQCAADGQDCSNSGCCQNKASTCFRKNQWWSSCNATCAPNMKWVDGAWVAQPEQVWDCTVVDPKTTS